MEGPPDFFKQSNVNTCTYVCIHLYIYHHTCDVNSGFRSSGVRGKVQLRIIGLSKREQERANPKPKPEASCR